MVRFLHDVHNNLVDFLETICRYILRQILTSLGTHTLNHLDDASYLNNITIVSNSLLQYTTEIEVTDAMFDALGGVSRLLEKYDEIAKPSVLSQSLPPTSTLTSETFSSFSPFTRLPTELRDAI